MLLFTLAMLLAAFGQLCNGDQIVFPEDSTCTDPQQTKIKLAHKDALRLSAWAYKKFYDTHFSTLRHRYFGESLYEKYNYHDIPRTLCRLLC